MSWLNDDLLEKCGLRRALPKDGKSFFYIEQIPQIPRALSPLLANDHETMKALAAFVAGCPEGRLDSGDIARFYGSPAGQGRRIKKETIVKHAADFGLVAMENAYNGTFTLFACPTVVAPAPATRYLEPPELAVVLSAPRTDVSVKSGSTLARLAALRAADVLTDTEFARLNARVEPPPPRPPSAAPTHLPGFAPAKSDAGALRAATAADARAEAGLG